MVTPTHTIIGKAELDGIEKGYGTQYPDTHTYAM